MNGTTAILRDLGVLFSSRLHIDVPSPETDLIDSGLLDSLRLVQLLLHIEDDLGCRLPIDELDLDDLRSLSRLAAVIAEHRVLSVAAAA